MTVYRLYDGLFGRPGVGSSGTQPPAAGSAFSGAYIAGLIFSVSAGGLWFQGYQWYVAATGQDLSGWKFALRQVTNNTAATSPVIPGSVITGGTLTAGQFNFVPLSTPLLLTPNVPYCAAVGKTVVTGFPDTVNQYAVGAAYPSGVTSGPLFMRPSGNAVMIDIGLPQSPFSTTQGSDPSTGMPATNNNNDNLWLDVQVTDVAPAGATYQAWPNMPIPYPRVVTTTDQTGYTLGFQFSLGQACTLTRIWHYSPSGSTVLPTRCQIWDVAGQSIVAGTDNQAPTWSGAAGSGWISVDYTSSGVTLQSGKQYKVATFHAAGTNWFAANANIFGAGNFQGNTWTAGPLTIPNNAAASPGQASWNPVTFAYPNTSTNPESDWIDVEVTPVPVGPAQLIQQQQQSGRSMLRKRLMYADI